VPDHYQELLVLLKSEDIMEVMQGVSQLSSELVMAQDDVLGSFPLDLMTPPLVECLRKEGIEDVGLYAINCLNQLAESLPNVCSIIAACNGIPALCSKLVNLSYIDVSEQAIKLLEKLAYEHAPQILQEGGLCTLLNVMDFFEVGTQRQILSLLSNLARGVLSQDLFKGQVSPALPLLATLLQYRSQDYLPTNEKALEFFGSLVTALERICRNSHDALREDLEELRENGVLEHSMRLAQEAPQLRPQVFRLLAGLCKGSIPALSEWLHMGGAQMLAATLEQDGETRLGAYVLEALQLIDAVLPGKGSRESEMQGFYTAQPELLTSLGEMLIPRLLQLYERFVNKTVRQMTLDILEKLLIHEHFLRSIAPRDAAIFLSALLCSKDLPTVKKALSMAKALYEKVPELVACYFVREGVIYRVEALKQAELKFELPSPVRESPGRNRLRFLLEGMDSSMEPRLLDQFLRHMRRRGLEDEDFDMPLAERLKRTSSERSDPGRDLRTEVDTLSNEVLAAHQRLGKDAFARVLLDLKALSHRLFACSGDDPEPQLGQFLQMMGSPEGVSAFEMSSSGMAAAVWRWVTCGQDFGDPIVPPKRLAAFGVRVKELLRALWKEKERGVSYFQVLVQLLQEVVARDQQLPLTLYDSPAGGLVLGLRTLAQRTQVMLAYLPEQPVAAVSSEVRAEIDSKTALFASIGSLGIAIEQYQPLSSLAEVLSKVQSATDLDQFRLSSFRAPSRFRGISEGQLSLLRQHLRLQQMLSENFDLRTSLNELGLLGEGHEELIEQLQDQLHRDVEEADEEEVAPRQPTGVQSSAVTAQLLFNQVPVPPHTTVFEALSRYSDPLSEEPLTLQFRFIPKESVAPNDAAKFLSGQHALLWQVLKEAANVGLEVADPLLSPLRVLKLLHYLNRLQPLTRGSVLFPGEDLPRVPLPNALFQSQKLTALLGKQSQDVVALIGHTASDWVWRLPLKCSFAFPFPLRVQFFRVSGLLPAKALQLFAGRIKVSGDILQLRAPRQKIQVDRDHVLEIAIRTLSDQTLLQHAALDFNYPNEEGTGAGPTLEFYSLTAREVRGQKMWRNAGEEAGLFPAPGDEGLFEFVGRFVGKVLSEDKVVDLPLSPAFWKLVFGATMTLGDLQQVDKALHRHLSDLAEVAARRSWILSNPSFTPDMKDRQLSQLTFRGTAISDLGLSFVLPGYDLPLKPNGKDTLVTLDSLEEYVHLAAEKTLMQTSQATAFRRGLELSVSVRFLAGFTGEELETLLCGEDGGKWDYDTLLESVVPAHGYTKSSTVYRQLLQVMSELSPADKKLCLQFLTGCPRLPIGGTAYSGFKALNPPLTVVRKSTSGPADQYLPSVMTCQNYLKVPEYSAVEVVRKQFRYAFVEAHDAFHLS